MTKIVKFRVLYIRAYSLLDVRHHGQQQIETDEAWNDVVEDEVCVSIPNLTSACAIESRETHLSVIYAHLHVCNIDKRFALFLR